MSSKLIKNFCQKLWPNNLELQEKLFKSLTSEETNKRALIMLKDAVIKSVPANLWQKDFIVIPEEEINAGLDPRHQAGDYYCFDVSSAFLISALTQVSIKPKRILDLCAAPGGKTVFVARAFAPELLIANEVINSRLAALISNLKRCNIKPCAVTCMDPARISEQTAECFDLVVVDAPCSGQSMYPLGKQYASAFHQVQIAKNASRQKRIISEASKTVTAGGYLCYLTCTFAPQENEKVIDWFLKKNPEFEAVKVPEYEQQQSDFSNTYCYRVFPFDNLGAGGFVALLRKKEAEALQVASASGEFGALTSSSEILEKLKIAWKQGI